MSTHMIHLAPDGCLVHETLSYKVFECRALCREVINFARKLLSRLAIVGEINFSRGPFSNMSVQNGISITEKLFCVRDYNLEGYFGNLTYLDFP